MAISTFTGREIIFVAITHIRSGQLDDGEEMAVATVEMNVSDAYYPEQRGPGVKVEIGLLPDPDISLQGLETAALEAAHALLRRLAEEPIEQLRETYSRCRAS